MLLYIFVAINRVMLWIIRIYPIFIVKLYISTIVDCVYCIRWFNDLSVIVGNFTCNGIDFEKQTIKAFTRQFIRDEQLRGEVQTKRGCLGGYHKVKIIFCRSASRGRRSLENPVTYHGNTGFVTENRRIIDEIAWRNQSVIEPFHESHSVNYRGLFIHSCQDLGERFWHKICAWKYRSVHNFTINSASGMSRIFDVTLSSLWASTWWVDNTR